MHQCGGMAELARRAACPLAVIPRSRGVTELPHTRRTMHQEGDPNIPTGTRRNRTAFDRIEDPERAVVMLLAIHQVAHERKSVPESDMKFDLFAAQIRSGRQGRDLVKRP